MASSVTSASSMTATSSASVSTSSSIKATTLSTAEQTAGRIIMRTLRRTCAPTNHIQKDREVLATLPSGKFERAILRTSYRWKARPRSLHLIPMSPAHLRELEEQVSFAYLHEARRTYHTTRTFPSFRERGVGLLPHWEMQSSSTTFSIKYSRAAEASTYIPTREELDTLVKTLATRKDLFPWDYKRDGCYARAMLIIRMLELMGVPKDRLGKMVISVPLTSALRVRGTQDWYYHTVATLTLADGSVVVLDPALEPDRALSQEEFVRAQITSSSSLQVLSPQKGPATARYNPQHPVLFQTSPYLRVASIDLNVGAITLEEETGESAVRDLSILAQYRTLLDSRFLSKSLPVTPTYLEAGYTRPTMLHKASHLC